MELSGRKINLRDIEEKDKDALKHWLQPHHEWHKLNGPYYPPTPEDKIDELLGNWIVSELPTPRRRLLIAHQTSDDVIGIVSCYWISRETDWMAIGISIYDPNNWGQGYGYDAMYLWCDYLFASYPQFVRLDMRTWSGNHGMMALAEKLNFTLEARFRQARIVGGEYYDGLGYGILRREWESRR